jgi:dihydroneopterin aldolase
VDKIVVWELPVRARVGVTDAERAETQVLLVDVELVLDLSRAGRSDRLGDTIDYVAVCAALSEIAGARPFRLIEAVAEAMAQAVLERFVVTEVGVRVKKPGALVAWNVAYAAVEIRRGRDG